MHSTSMILSPGAKPETGLDGTPQFQPAKDLKLTPEQPELFLVETAHST